jgi:hypothetical protein
MGTGFLYNLDEWLIGALILAALVAALEGGFRLARRAGRKMEERSPRPIAGVTAALLAVLGLLVAFTLSMTVSRYETRRQLVIQEANAIRTAYLRAQALGEPEGPGIASALRTYLDRRIERAQAGGDVQRVDQITASEDRLQKELWSLAVTAVRKDRRSVPAGLMLQALNTAIELRAARRAAVLNQVPPTVIWCGILIAEMSMIMVGYLFGLSRFRNLLSMWLLAGSILLVLLVIIDLDRPAHGLIRISQGPMIELQAQLAPVTANTLPP